MSNEKTEDERREDEIVEKVLEKHAERMRKINEEEPQEEKPIRKVVVGVFLDVPTTTIICGMKYQQNPSTFEELTISVNGELSPASIMKTYLEENDRFREHMINEYPDFMDKLREYEENEEN